MIRSRSAVALLALATVLAGCTAAPAPSPTSTEVARLEACAAAASSIVTAAGDLVAEYELPGLDPSATPAPGVTATPAPAPTSSGDAITDAVTSARATRDELGCDREQFTEDLESGLARIEPETPIAAAVWRRVSASVLGTVEQAARVWELAAGDDLLDVLARAADGSTIELAPETEVDATLVLLAGITLRGAGRDDTVLRSSAPDAAIMVVTDGLVRLESLTLQLGLGDPSSGIVAGPSASIVLNGVRVTGAATKGEGDSAGGAGVYLSAQGAEGSGRGTTLEITDSLFDGNAWAGLAVTGGHRVSIESSTFRGNAGAGIVFLDQTSGSVGSSTFTDNTVGVAAAGTSTPAIVGSTITGGTVGLQADASAAPAVQKVTISGPSSAAIIFGGESGGSVSDTTCRDVSHGIVVGDGAAPTLGSNDCTLARGTG